MIWIFVGALVALVAGVFAWVALHARRTRLDPDGRRVGPRLASDENPAIERRRQRAVDALHILDTPSEERFDRIVSMARQLYRTEWAVFSVIDNDRGWHKSRSGEGAREGTARSNSLCAVTIRGTGAMIVGDAFEDERLKDTPGIHEGAGVRFYAGFPVQAPGGEHIGALCVYDPQPREVAEVDDTMLRQLAHLIEVELRTPRR